MSAKIFPEAPWEHSPVIPVMQRTNKDCSFCCFAMAFRQTYEAMEIFIKENTNNPVGDNGWNGQAYYDAFAVKGYEALYQPRWFDPRRPAIISVQSRLNVGGYHAIYYENGMVYDPTTVTFPYELSPALQSVVAFYQWEPMRHADYHLFTLEREQAKNVQGDKP